MTPLSQLRLAVAAATLLAHQLAAQTPAAPRIRDSAGVRIVEHTTIKTSGVAFVIAATPFLDLGGLKDDPREEFESRSPFMIAKRLSDGRIVATDNHALKLFDANGKIVRILGRKGSGPGEFNQVRDVCVARGDTIVGIGYGDYRVNVFDTTGRVVKTFTSGKFIPYDPCFTDGSILVVASTTVNPASRRAPNVAAALDRVASVERYRLDGTSMGPAGRFAAGAEMVPFAPRGHTVVRRDSIYAGDGQMASVTVHGPSGTLARIIRWNDARIAVTDAMLEEGATFWPVAGSPPEAFARARERLRLQPHPASIPAYDGIKVDAAGRIWIQDYRYRTTEPRSWTVFVGAGALLGRVAVPNVGNDKHGFVEVMDIGADFIVLRWRDDVDGAAHLSFHRLKGNR